MIRCCVAELLVRTRLGAFPPIITAPSHLSRFTNFGCRVCSKCLLGVEGSFTITKQASYTDGRERKGREAKKTEGKAKEKKNNNTEIHIFIIIAAINKCLYSKNGRDCSKLQEFRTMFVACVVLWIDFSYIYLKKLLASPVITSLHHFE